MNTLRPNEQPPEKNSLLQTVLAKVSEGVNMTRRQFLKVAVAAGFAASGTAHSSPDSMNSVNLAEHKQSTFKAQDASMKALREKLRIAHERSEMAKIKTLEEVFGKEAVEKACRKMEELRPGQTVVVACMDERVPEDNENEFKFAVPGTGALLDEAHKDEVAGKLKSLEKRGVNVKCSEHDACLACALAAQEAQKNGKQDATPEKVGHESATDLQKRIGGSEKQPLSYVFDAEKKEGRKMKGHEEYHHARRIVIDLDNVMMAPKYLNLEDSIKISGYTDDMTLLASNTNTAMVKILLDDHHGYGAKVFSQDPAEIVVIGSQEKLTAFDKAFASHRAKYPQGATHYSMVLTA